MPTQTAAQKDDKETVSNIASTDITQAMYMRNLELLAERRHAEDLLYNISEGVLAVDQSYRIVLFNHTLETMLKTPETAAVGKNLTDIIKIETQEGKNIDLVSFCFPKENREEIISDVVLRGPDKNYFVNVRFSVITSERDKSTLECLITISDITKEILLDKAKDDFLSLASHELRTPMTVIKSYLAMIQRTSPDTLTDKQVSYLSKTIKSTNELINLVNDMLNISRMEQGRINFEVKPVVLGTILEDSISGFDLRAKEQGIDLIKRFNGLENTSILIDSGKFKEIVTNLLGNAIKFTKVGSVTVKVEQNDEFLKISIIDTGAGISEEDSKKLFQKFGMAEGSYTRADESGGTGLGLYIVKLYAEAMGGKTGFHSDGPLKGSTFWFTIPIGTEKVNSIGPV